MKKAAWKKQKKHRLYICNCCAIYGMWWGIWKEWSIFALLTPDHYYNGIFYETGREKILGADMIKNVIKDLLVFMIPVMLGICQRETMEYQYHMQPLIVTKRLGRKEYRRSLK